MNLDTAPVHWIGWGVAAALAAALAAIGTPVAIRAAVATGFVDRPGGALKKHSDPTPYLGGMAVFVPFITAAGLVFELDQRFLGVLLAATLAALLGLMDDFGAMRPGVKLIGQLLIVLVLLRADVRVELDVLPPTVNVLLTTFWMLAIMNAVNFLDIMDGLAATVSLIAAAFFMAVAVATSSLHLASLSAVLVGALAGYLRFSLPKARIFLGDCGSLFLGTTLGALALALDYSRVNRWAVVAPLLILAAPAFEITFTILARVLHGRAPWRGSPDHVALRLRRRGLSVSQVLMVAASAGVVGGSLSLWMVHLPAAAAPWVLGGGLLAALAFGGWLARDVDATA